MKTCGISASPFGPTPLISPRRGLSPGDRRVRQRSSTTGRDGGRPRTAQLQSASQLRNLFAVSIRHHRRRRPAPCFDNLQWPGVATVANLPVAAVPTGRLVDGLPAGVQLIGLYLEDRTPSASLNWFRAKWAASSRPQQRRNYLRVDPRRIDSLTMGWARAASEVLC